MRYICINKSLLISLCRSTYLNKAENQLNIGLHFIDLQWKISTFK